MANVSIANFAMVTLCIIGTIGHMAAKDRKT